MPAMLLEPGAAGALAPGDRDETPGQSNPSQALCGSKLCGNCRGYRIDIGK